MCWLIGLSHDSGILVGRVGRCHGRRKFNVHSGLRYYQRPGRSVLEEDGSEEVSVCAVEGCERESDKSFGGRRGFCGKHYSKWRKYGDPLEGVERLRKKKNGEGSIRPNGYRMMGINGKRISEHRLIIGKVLGHPIPEGSIPHHVDENRSHNENNNLVLCDSVSYHKLLHMRMEAIKACGRANWRRCWICREYDDPGNMHISYRPARAYHLRCSNEYQRKRKIEKRSLQCGCTA